jgi:flagellar biosynthesis GTPase FlhF
MPKQDSTIIKWTEQEREYVARQSLLKLAISPQLTRVQAVQAAVMGLPAARRRYIKELKAVPWIEPLWTQIGAELDAAGKKPEAAAIEEGVDLLSPGARPKRRGNVPGAKLTRWNGAERRAVAKAFLKIRHDFPDMLELHALRKAIADVLPADRQRAIETMWHARPWLDPLLDEVKSEVEIERAEAKRHALEREQEERNRIEIERQSTQAIQTQAAQLAEEKLQAQAAELRAELQSEISATYLANAPIEDLIGAAMRRVAGAFLRPFVDELRDGLQDVLKTAAAGLKQQPTSQPIPAPRERRPRVVIAGLINQQIRDIENEYGGRLDLSFVKNAEEGGAGTTGKVSNAEVVLACTDFLSHSLEAQLKRHARQYYRITGSVSALRRWLNQWLASDTRQAA